MRYAHRRLKHTNYADELSGSHTKHTAHKDTAHGGRRHPPHTHTGVNVADCPALSFVFVN